jgi:WD40 repeat protein
MISSRTPHRAALAAVFSTVVFWLANSRAEDVNVQWSAEEHVDLYGDPLPAGAVCRLGTVRYRQGGSRSRLHFLDEATVLAGSESGEVHVWDLTTGRRKKTVRTRGYLQAVAVSRDGVVLAALANKFDRAARMYNCSLALWDLKMGGVRRTIAWREPLTSSPTCLAWTPDGTTLVTGGRNGRLRFWDVASGDEILSHELARDEVEDVAFSPDGKHLALAGRRGAYLWEWTSGAEPESLPGLERGAQGVAFSPDGKLLATSSDEDNGLRLWSVAARQVVQRIRGGRNYSPTVAFTPDGRRLAASASGNAGGVEVWDVASGRRAGAFGGVRYLSSLAVSPDGRWLAGAGQNVVNVFDLETGDPLHRRFTGHEEEIYELEFTPDGKSVVTSGMDPLARVWDARTGRPLQALRHDKGMVRALAASPDGKLLASSALDDTVAVWDRETGRRVFRLPGHGELGGRRNLRFTPDGGRFHSFGDDLFLRTWDVRTGKALAEHLLRPTGLKVTLDDIGVPEVSGGPFGGGPSLDKGRFTGDAKHLLLQVGGAIHAMEVESGKELWRYQPKFSLEDFAASPDGKWLATAEQETLPPPPADPEKHVSRGSLRIVNLAPPHDLVREIELPGRYHRAPVFSPDSRLVVLGGRGQDDDDDPQYWIAAWSVENGKLAYRIPNSASNLFALAFAPDGKRLASSHGDTTALVWDLEQFRTEPEVEK